MRCVTLILRRHGATLRGSLAYPCIEFSRLLVMRRGMGMPKHMFEFTIAMTLLAFAPSQRHLIAGQHSSVLMQRPLTLPSIDPPGRFLHNRRRQPRNGPQPKAHLWSLGGVVRRRSRVRRVTLQVHTR